MKKYEVISYFTDLRDYDHAYNVGDEFPRQGVNVSEERIAELSSSKNKQRRPLIKAVEDQGGQKPGEQKPQNPAVPDAEPESTVNPENKEEPGTPENAGSPDTTEETKQPGPPDTSGGSNNKYSKEDIEALKLPQIRELAGKLGFKISSTSKDKAVAEFMEKQG